MKRSGVIAFVGIISVILMAFIPAQAMITGVWIEPAEPSPEDTVILHVEGYLPDGCWGVGPHSVTRNGGAITVDIYAVDFWQPGWGCVQIIVEYTFTDTLGLLPARSYGVAVHEFHESLRDPETEYRLFPFEVTGAVSECLCPCHADPQCDGVINVLDVVWSVNCAFRSMGGCLDAGAACNIEQNTDVDCSGETNVLDVVHFVNVAFRSGDPDVEFCDPCTP